MSEEMFLAILPQANGVKLRWEAAEAFIAQMTRDDLERALTQISGDRLDEDDDETEARERVATLAAEVREAIEALDSGGDAGGAEWFGISGWRLYIAGGSSYGGSPTEMFDAFTNFAEIGLAEAVGFYGSDMVDRLVDQFLADELTGQELAACLQELGYGTKARA